MMPVANYFPTFGPNTPKMRTRVPLRRLGMDIPKGTPVTPSRIYMGGGIVEMIVRTEHGGFVVSPEDIEAYQ